MHKIGIISDTHGLLRPETIKALQGCDAILHGGDINKQQILDELKKIAPIYAVRGNNDKEWADGLPESLSFKLYGIRFFMVHNKKDITKGTVDADIIIYGHSHKYEEKYVKEQLWLNPGSCGPRRFAQPITMAVLEIAEDSSYQVTKIVIPHKSSAAKGNEVSEEEKIPQNIKQVIGFVIKDTNKGFSVKEIAGRHGISEELAEQICRLYLTHPGVDADGIMGKMGL